MLAFFLVLLLPGCVLAAEQPGRVDSLKNAAEQGHADAQYKLGLRHRVTRNNEEAFKWFHKAALQGDARAQRQLGNLYYFGWGIIPQDYGKLSSGFTRRPYKGINGRS